MTKNKQTESFLNNSCSNYGIKIASIIIFCCITSAATSQSSIKINNETFQAKLFTETGTLGFTELDMNTSPFKSSPEKLTDTTLCGIGYSFLGHFCPPMESVRNMDYVKHRSFLPLFMGENYDEVWDDMVMKYFTDKITGVDDEFRKTFLAQADSKAKKVLLNDPKNIKHKEFLYRKLLLVKEAPFYSATTDKETKMKTDLKTSVEANLASVFAANPAIGKNVKAEIRLKVQASIQREFKSHNFVKLRYFSLSINGDMEEIIEDFAANICKKKKANPPEALSGMESKFHDKYMAVAYGQAFLITDMHYVLYYIDKNSMTSMVDKISTTVDAILAEKNVDASVNFSFSFWIERKNSIVSTFKADGGFILQVAENKRIAAIPDCK